MPSCSKAPRGLFVLVYVGRIFTAIALFAESVVKTVLKSLHLSCGSELTRQGTSLAILHPVFCGTTIFNLKILHVAMQTPLYLVLITVRTLTYSVWGFPGVTPGSFLLIIRTCNIFTNLKLVVQDTRMFQHIVRFSSGGCRTEVFHLTMAAHIPP